MLFCVKKNFGRKGSCIGVSLIGKVVWHNSSAILLFLRIKSVFDPNFLTLNYIFSKSLNRECHLEYDYKHERFQIGRYNIFEFVLGKS